MFSIETALFDGGAFLPLALLVLSLVLGLVVSKLSGSARNDGAWQE